MSKRRPTGKSACELDRRAKAGRRPKRVLSDAAHDKTASAPGSAYEPLSDRLTMATILKLCRNMEKQR